MKKVLLRINQVLIFTGSILLFFMMVLDVGNIILRLLGYPIKGTFELMGFGGALVVGFALGGTQQTRGHIEVGLFKDRWPAPIRPWVDAISYLLSILFWSLIAYKLFNIALVLHSCGELSETLNIPYYPLVILLGMGVSFMLVILIHQAVFSRKKG